MVSYLKITQRAQYPVIKLLILNHKIEGPYNFRFIPESRSQPSKENTAQQIDKEDDNDDETHDGGDDDTDGDGDDDNMMMRMMITVTAAMLMTGRFFYSPCYAGAVSTDLFRPTKPQQTCRNLQNHRAH